jgi:hypothetical protein
VSGIDWQSEAETAIDAVIAAHTRCGALTAILSAALALANRQRIEIDRQAKTIARLRDELRQQRQIARAA